MLRRVTFAALLVAACNDDDRLSRIESRLIEIEGRLARIDSAAEKKAEPAAVELPRALAGEDSSAALQITLAPTRVFIDGMPVTDEELVTRLAAAARSDPSTSVVIRAEADVPYQRVVEVIDRATQAGLRKLSFGAGPEPPVVMSH